MTDQVWKKFSEGGPETGRMVWAVTEDDKVIFSTWLGSIQCKYWCYITPPPLPKPEQKCPWCKSDFKAARGGSKYWALCSNADCRATGPLRPTEAEALETFGKAKVEK